MFESEKSQANGTTRKVYAFIGLGMMARFMGEDKIAELEASFPAAFARQCAVKAEDLVVVAGRDWVPAEKQDAVAINFDGSQAFPGEAERLAENYLRALGLSDHFVGDIMLLGVIGPGGHLAFGTAEDLSSDGLEVNGATILVSALLAFHRSALGL